VGLHCEENGERDVGETKTSSPKFGGTSKRDPRENNLAALHRHWGNSRKGRSSPIRTKSWKAGHTK